MKSEQFTYKGRHVTISQEPTGHWSAQLDRVVLKLEFSFEVGFDDARHKDIAHRIGQIGNRHSWLDSGCKQGLGAWSAKCHEGGVSMALTKPEFR